MAPRALFVLIDPVRGFTAETGSFARAHGHNEMAPIRESVARISAFISGLDPGVPMAWIRPIYRPGQFETEGPMARVCLRRSSDVTFDPQLLPPPTAAVIEKNDMDATESPAFLDWLSAVRAAGYDSVCIAGFLLTSCVRRTALSLEAWAGQSMAIEVPRALCASRRSKYISGSDPSEVESALIEMGAAGITTPEHSVLL